MGLTISCWLPKCYITFINQTAYEVDLYADTLYLMTMKPNSIEKSTLKWVLPSSVYIKSPSIGYVRIGSNYLFDSIVGVDTFYNTQRFKAQIDDSVIVEYNILQRMLFEQKTTVLQFMDR